MRLAPLQNFMKHLLDTIQARDTGNIFGEPVDQNEVPDYADVVKEPMDFSTMRMKLESYEYHTLDDFHRDFILMVNNCLAYNSKETVFYRAGVKMRDQVRFGSSIVVVELFDSISCCFSILFCKFCRVEL